MELLLKDAVDKLDLLLFLQLGAVLGDLLAAGAAGVAGRLFIAIAHDGRRNVKAPALLGDRLLVDSHCS